jgi:pterin-4a-carbinolamine dehydratase
MFSFCTHDVGNKLTNVDFELAKELTSAAKYFQK